MPNPTLRTLAAQLGLSRTTISDALRGSSRVKQATIDRVLVAAKEAGYKHNPLTGTVMSLLRRSDGQDFRGMIGVLDFIPENRSDHAQRYSDTVHEGIVKRAEQLGFKAERFEIGPNGMHLKRLDTILHTRGIQALVVLPVVGFPDLTELNWDRYTAVYADYFIDRPSLHCVCSDHYRSMVALLQETHRRGYRRPGLYIEIALDERLQFRWEGAFVALQKYLPDITEVPPLRVTSFSREAFLQWFTQYQPDVVFCHQAEALDWMIEAGARVPETHGFVCLNSLRAPADCASLDFQSGELGSRATDLVTSQLLHNEMGVPSQPSLTTIPALLCEGRTLPARKSGTPKTTKPQTTPRPAKKTRRGTKASQSNKAG